MKKRGENEKMRKQLKNVEKIAKKEKMNKKRKNGF